MADKTQSNGSGTATQPGAGERTDDDNPTPSGDGTAREEQVNITLTDEQFERFMSERAEEPTDEDVANADRGDSGTDGGGQRTPLNPNGDPHADEDEGRARSGQTLPQGTPVEVGTDGRLVVGEQRDVDGFDACCMQTYRMLCGTMSRNFKKVRRAQTALARAGHYGGEQQERARQMEGERALMLTDDDGEPFLPVTIENRVQELRHEYGVVRDLATTFTISSGSAKVPNTTAEISVDAVTEGSIITTRKVTFNRVELDPKKWGTIIGWTNELQDEVGAQVVANATETVSRAFAKAEDESVLTADGTPSYHNLVGILNDPAVPLVRIAGGDNADGTNFADLRYEDLLDMPMAVHQGARGNFRYIFNTDFEFVMAKFRDPQGAYIYGVNGTGVTRAWGKPIRWTQAMPGIEGSAADKVFGTSGDFRTVNMAFRGGLSATRLTEATIQDADDPNAMVHLAAQDSQAIRFVAKWDVAYPFPQAFANISTAAV